MRRNKARLLVLAALLLVSCSLLGTPAALTATPAQPSSPSTVAAPASNTAAPSAASPVPAPTQTAPTAVKVQTDAQVFPDASAYRWMPVVYGMASPIDVEFPDDGTGRMFVVEQDGRVRIIENGQMLDPPFLDIISKVDSQGNEQGLLGLAFHPDFKAHPYFYVNYIDQRGNTVIARFTASGNLADPASEKVLLNIQQPFSNHNGGEMVFGPDGLLYMGLGDGGSQGDPHGNGQNTNVLLGKILRLDVDHGDPYAIPAGNPFARGGGRPEIWAYGLRNPWRFSFDRATGDLYIGDVGQDLWEEVDVVSGQTGGWNFGWNYYEGMHPYAGTPPAGVHFTFPVAEYSHAEGGCAIIGGDVYRGAMSAWQGIYFYGDDCTGYIWGLLHSPAGWQSQLLFRTDAYVTGFGLDPSGEIYFADRHGTIYRLSQ